MIVAGIGLIAFRDPKGIRPLSLGKNKDSFLIASESSAISAMGYKFEGDIKPGQAIIIDEQGTVDKKRPMKGSSNQPCLFEYVYFSRPDSTIDEISVHKSRLRMGDF